MLHSIFMKRLKGKHKNDRRFANFANCATQKAPYAIYAWQYFCLFRSHPARRLSIQYQAFKGIYGSRATDPPGLDQRFPQIRLELRILRCQIALVRQRCLAALPGRFLPRLGPIHLSVSALFYSAASLRGANRPSTSARSFAVTAVSVFRKGPNPLDFSSVVSFR